MERITRVCVYETTSADPACADAELQAQGRSMRDAMVADLLAVDGVQVGVAVLDDGRQDGMGPVRGSQAMDTGGDPDQACRLRTASLAPLETPLEFLHRQALQNDFVWVVAPESGGMLAELRAAICDRQWLGCSLDAIAITASKRATASLLRSVGIAATDSWQPADEPDDVVRDGNWVVKPDDGCGAFGVRRHPDHGNALADLVDRRRRGENAVMEPWIEGEPLSLSLLCGETTVDVLSINCQRLAFDPSGSLHFLGVTPETANVHGSREGRTIAMAALARRIKDVLPGLRGYVGVDVTWHPERGPVVIEINPRMTCAYPGLSKRVGFNVAARMLSLHRRTRVEGSPAARETADRD